ncbi:MAG TPA: methyltransferase domain-containing protein [Candidatus Magasanikbacteria bacterium]|nr:methyltransferase domain-containing protein [Candidatus Magasanikbacteria bacterium]
MQYAFQLGRETEISAIEADIVLEQMKVKIARRNLKNGIWRIETNHEFDTNSLMHQLGGTIKIMRALSIPATAETISRYLGEIVLEGKISFSITGGDRRLPVMVKKILKSSGRSARFVETVNSASILFNGLVTDHTDLTILDNELFVTDTIQPFEAFSQRDFGRPATDNLSGMLPPKLARMMINLSGVTPSATLLDPYCGSGTIITEAAELGFKNIIGTDNSPRAISDTTKNLEWLEKKLQITTDKKIFHCDVRQIHEALKKNSVDAVVCEPYLGIPLHGNEREDTIRHEMINLSNLYSDGFKSLSQIMKLTGVMITVIPKFKVGADKWAEIDVAKLLPSNLIISPWSADKPHLTYFRPDQKLARQIYRIKKTSL